jgi:hypothetical protein
MPCRARLPSQLALWLDGNPTFAPSVSWSTRACDRIDAYDRDVADLESQLGDPSNAVVFTTRGVINSIDPARSPSVNNRIGLTPMPA